jgi:hypothetical protein
MRQRLQRLQQYITGIIEVVTTEYFPPETGNQLASLEAAPLAADLKSAVERYLQVLPKLEIMPPVIISFSLTDVRGYLFRFYDRAFSGSLPIDRDKLELPQLLIQGFDISAHEVIRPALDALWNAGGLTRCHFYNDEGDWILKW